jgi:flagellar basal-body rod protein FlgC
MPRRAARKALPAVHPKGTSTMLNTLAISTSGLIAQRLRMDTIAGNIAHANTTQNERGEPAPFQRRLVVLQAETDSAATPAGGARVSAEVHIDTHTPPRKVYQPGHPHADQDGYVAYPNVNVITEFVNAMEAARAYEANLSAMQLTREMIDNSFKILG